MLRFETAGESHGECLVATLTGLPAGVPVHSETVNRELWRRQQGFGRGGRMKIETDCAEIVAGVRHSRTIGSPVAIIIRNRDWAKLRIQGVSKTFTGLDGGEYRALGEVNIDIARRTVAKYRESLKIRSSVERRREKAQMG